VTYLLILNLFEVWKFKKKTRNKNWIDDIEGSEGISVARREL
jgi:hypothetical protein